MGRPWQGKSQAKPGRKNKGKPVPDFNPDELDDAIDKFHKSKDKISLDVDDDNELSDDDMEEPVFNLKAESSEEDDDDDDDDDDENDDEDLDEDELSGLAAKMAKQAKILRQKTSLMEDEEDEEEDDEEKTKEKKAPWGKRKTAYYSADNIDFDLQSSDEETPADEESEALRLQRLKAESLRPEDFEFSEEEDQKNDDERSLQEIVDKREANNNKSTSIRGRHVGISFSDKNLFVEEVKKDVSALSKVEQMNVVMSDAPELLGLLAELKESLDELQNKVEPILLKVKKVNTANKGGLAFLETKHMLLLCYCQSILFYLLMKAEGRSVRDHPVIARLVELRTLLEKLQPIEEKVENQIKKLMSISITSPFVIESKETLKNSVEAEDKQIIQTHDIQTNAVSKENGQSSTKSPLDQTLEPESRQDKNRSGKELQNVPDMIHSDFFERVEDIELGKSLRLIESDEDDIDLPQSKSSLNKIISSKVQKKRKQITSGDMDLPLQDDLGDRRSKFEMRRVPSTNDVDYVDEPEEIAEEEDEFYKAAKRLKAAKKSTKENSHKIAAALQPVEEEEVGKRHITRQMEKNKGLTPHRNKLTKNPRKKYKLKHQKAVIRRKGQVREIKHPSGPYGGETTGIRTAISRSVRFKG